MSLAKKKVKETKGKQKMLPKLKAILANPNKTKCPILDEEVMDHLKLLLQNAIKESELEPRSFATQKGICLGLESSLRRINNQTSSCVFISLSIKPNHVIGLIARNAETKNELQPVYAQPKLEHFIEEIFGVQALCMVFPKDLSAISENINKWVQGRMKPTKAIPEEAPIKKNLKKKFKRTKTELNKIVKKECETKSEKAKKSWSGDFISFVKDHSENDTLKLEGDEAVEALSELIDKIPASKSVSTKNTSKSATMEVDNEEEAVGKNKVEGDSDNSDDFLGEYKSLTVHKIKGNPNKKPKKKRNKNKKKNK